MVEVLIVKFENIRAKHAKVMGIQWSSHLVFDDRERISMRQPTSLTQWAYQTQVM